LVVDTLGLLWALVITPASVQDRDGGKQALEEARRHVKHLQIIWVDAAYKATATWAWVLWGWLVEIVGRPKGRFEVQPKRWIVERTFGWWNRHRRLSKDYERTPESSRGFIFVAMIHLMVRRLA
jgi:putative transposase